MSNYIHVPPGSPEVPKLDITVSEREAPGYRQGALQLLRRLRPHWRPEEVTLQVRGRPGRVAGPAPASPTGDAAARAWGERKGEEGGRPLCGGAAASLPSPPPPPRSPNAAPCAEPHLLGSLAAGRVGAAASPAPSRLSSFPVARFPLPPLVPSPPKLGSPRPRLAERIALPPATPAAGPGAEGCGGGEGGGGRREASPSLGPCRAGRVRKAAGDLPPPRGRGGGGGGGRLAAVARRGTAAEVTAAEVTAAEAAGAGAGALPWAPSAREPLAGPPPRAVAWSE